MLRPKPTKDNLHAPSQLQALLQTNGEQAYHLLDEIGIYIVINVESDVMSFNTLRYVGMIIRQKDTRMLITDMVSEDSRLEARVQLLPAIMRRYQQYYDAAPEGKNNDD